MKREKLKIDLHTHTSYSDGTDTPAQLINKALAAGISIIGLTDHDSISGWQEATNALRVGISLVPGAEISCQTADGISVHILGLLFDSNNSELMDTLEKTRENRHGRMEKIIARINEAGIDITMNDVLEQLSDGATLGRPHLADALVKKGIVASRDEAFTQMLHNNSKYYVSHYSPTPEAAIKLIKAAGGVSVIADTLMVREMSAAPKSTISVSLASTSVSLLMTLPVAVKPAAVTPLTAVVVDSLAMLAS
jgi:predicted metal-dependent phosphoesterase TrpH